MSNSSQTAPAEGSQVRPLDVLDALVIGGGPAGIRALYSLKQLGLQVQLVERGSGVGGVWYWNRYPGARLDSDSISYGYFFSDELAEEWQWSEHFVTQPELERYYNFVVDRFDLRQHICLNTEAKELKFDEARNVWDVRFADGTTSTARHVIAATGMLSQPYVPPFKGLDDFAGTLVHTGEWPADGIDLAGKRVAVIGTGSSGIQVIPMIAEAAGSLTVFQREGHWASPLNNRPITPEEQEAYRTTFREIHRRRSTHPGGFIHEVEERRTFEVSEEERLRKYEEIYQSMGLRSMTSNFADTATDPAANKAYSDFVADKIRARVKDPVLAERLIPKSHGYGTHRPPKDTGYFEAYNRDNVRLVTLRDTPIVRFTQSGLETTDENYEFDVIILATGFDPWLGALRQIDIRGVSGQNLADYWETDGVTTYLGVATPNYPNFFFVAGAQSFGGNAPPFVENHADWIAELIDHAEKHGFTRVEATQEAAKAWVEHAIESAEQAQIIAKGSWYVRANVEGGVPNRTLVYFGGQQAWLDQSREAAANGYRGLSLS